MLLRKPILGVFLAGLIAVGLLARLGAIAPAMVRGEQAVASAVPGRDGAPFRLRGSHSVGTRDLVLEGGTEVRLEPGKV